jgi:hypothetical protein
MGQGQDQSGPAQDHDDDLQDRPLKTSKTFSSEKPFRSLATRLMAQAFNLQSVEQNRFGLPLAPGLTCSGHTGLSQTGKEPREDAVSKALTLCLDVPLRLPDGFSVSNGNERGARCFSGLLMGFLLLSVHLR